MPRPKKEPNEAIAATDDVAQVMYGKYVHGVSIADLAAEYRLDASEVLGMIVTIEQNRKLESKRDE